MAENSTGFSASELTGYSPEAVRRAAEALVAAGRLVRSKVSPRRVRYFANAQLAQSYSAAPPVRAMAAGTRFKAAWRADEPGVITSRTKIIVAPTPPRGVYRTNTYLQF